MAFLKEGNVLQSRRSSLRLSGSQKSMVYTACLLLLVFYGLFMVFPIAYSFVGSLHNWQPHRGKFDYVGFDNYAWLFQEELTWSALGNTLLFTAVVTVLRTGFGLAFAVLINEMKRSRAFFRTVYFLPVITSTVAVSMVWKWLYEPITGPLNYYIVQIGLPRSMFLRDASTALLSVMVMTVWKDMGYAVVLYMAGLSGVPASLYESAQIDGCSRWKAFWHITLPMLSATTMLILITSVITYCQTFTQIDLMTGGGPGTTSYTLVYMLYKEAFGSKYRFGRASAIAFFLFAIILVFSILQLRLNRKDGDAA